MRLTQTSFSMITLSLQTWPTQVPLPSCAQHFACKFTILLIIHNCAQLAQNQSLNKMALSFQSYHSVHCLMLLNLTVVLVCFPGLISKLSFFRCLYFILLTLSCLTVFKLYFDPELSETVFIKPMAPMEFCMPIHQTQLIL